MLFAGKGTGNGEALDGLVEDWTKTSGTPASFKACDTLPLVGRVE